MSVDEELGYVYLPVSTPTNDYYGGHRPGDGLYGDSLVCLDAATGREFWHYQLVHHGLWDYDTPAAPNLIDITVAGRRIKAVAQVTKQAFVYVFDRVTGEPVWPSRSSRCRRPAFLASERRRRSHFQPSRHRSTFRACATTIDRPFAGNSQASDRHRRRIRPWTFIPPSLGTRHHHMPGVGGSGNWRAPRSIRKRMLYVGTYRLPFVIKLRKPSRRKSSYDFIGEFRYLSGRSDCAVQAAVRQHRRHRHEQRRAPLAHSIGRAELTQPSSNSVSANDWDFPRASWALVTKTVMIVVQSGYFGAPRLPPGGTRRLADLNNFDPHLWVYDKASGEMLARLRLPPMPSVRRSPIWRAAKQFIVFPVGGGPLVEETDRGGALTGTNGQIAQQASTPRPPHMSSKHRQHSHIEAEDRGSWRDGKGQRGNIDARPDRHVERQPERSPGTVLPEHVCSANQIDRLRITPTTAAVIADSAPASPLLPRNGFDERARQENPQEAGVNVTQVASNPPSVPASIGDSGRDRKRGHEADELQHHDQRPRRGLGHAEASSISRGLTQ